MNKVIFQAGSKGSVDDDRNLSLSVSVCWYLPRVKCQFGVSGPLCHGNLSWLGVNR